APTGSPPKPCPRNRHQNLVCGVEFHRGMVATVELKASVMASEASLPHAGAIRRLVCGILRTLGIDPRELGIVRLRAGALPCRRRPARFSGSAVVPCLLQCPPSPTPS